MEENIAKGKFNAKLANNQVVFRKKNSQVRSFINDIENLPHERGLKPHKFRVTDTYHFYCECSDENCREQIVMSIGTYEKLHVRDDTFIIKPGHKVLDIEETTVSEDTYCVVKKFETPSQSTTRLRSTPLDHTTDS